MPIDMSRATAPPKKTGSVRSASRSPIPMVEPEQTPRARRTEGLMGMASLGQGLSVMVGQYADAAAIGIHAPKLSEEIAGLADRYEWLGNGIDLVIQVGPFAGLLAAAMPFALQIGANHGKFDATKLHGQGVVPPEVLEAQMSARLAKMQADAMREQQEAINEAREAQRAYEQMMQEAV